MTTLYLKKKTYIYWLKHRFNQWKLLKIFREEEKHILAS